MQAKLLKKNDPEAGREYMENGRILDEPVYDKTHESEILRAENKAAGIKEEPKESESDCAGISPEPRKKKEETGVVSSVKKFMQAPAQEAFRHRNHHQRRVARNPHWHHEKQSIGGFHHRAE